MAMPKIPGLADPTLLVGGLEGEGAGVLGGLTKAAARDALETLGIEGAQKAAARSAIGRATSTTTIDLIHDEEKTLTVRLTRPGRNGRQVIESTISPSGSKSVVQRAYDAAGNLVHYDPKTP